MTPPTKGEPAAHDAGFALADALTGLTILASTIVLSINVAAIARRASLSALEHRQAARALDQRLVLPLAELGSQSGPTPAPWRVDLGVDSRLTGSDAGAACRRTVSVAGRRAGRSYTAATLETCPEPRS